MNHRKTPYCIFAVFMFLLGAFGHAHAQGSYSLRVVHMMAGAPNADVFLDGNTPAMFSNLEYEYTSTLAQQLPVPGPQINLQVAPAGAGIGGAIINQMVNVAASTDYTAVIYRIGTQPKLIALSRPRNLVPGPGKAHLRVLNITSLSTPGSFDFYLDSARGTPVFAGVNAEAASPWLEVKGEPRTLFITAAGSTTVLAQMVIPVVSSGRLTLIVTGTSTSELKVHALAGEMVDGYKLPLLQGMAGGALSSVRVVHVWWQKTVDGNRLQPLDIFVNDGVQPRIGDLRYRQASEKMGPFTENEVTVKFAPVNEGAGNPVYQTTIPLHRDTDYVTILTKSKEGAPAALTLGAPNTISTAMDSFKIRAAYVSDFHSDVIVKITPQGHDPIVLPPVQFLTATDWYTIPRGPFTVTAEKPNESAPFYTNNVHGLFASTYLTVLVLGSDQTFELDILNEMLPTIQVFDPSSGVPGIPMPGERSIAMRALPNPAGDFAVVNFALERPAQGTLSLHDVLGRVVATVAEGSFDAGANSVRAELASLPQGLYFLRLRTEQGEQGTGRIVVGR